MKIFFRELHNFFTKFFKKRERYKLTLINIDNDKWSVYCKGVNEEYFLTFNDIQNGKLKEEIKRLSNRIMEIKGGK